MNDLYGKYGGWAMVAGAAEGLGAGFTEEIAKKGFNIILIDHREKELNEFAEKMETLHGIETIRLLLDLSVRSAADQCLETAAEKDCRLLVYVAAYSWVRQFNDYSPHDLDRFIDTNCRTPLHLVHAFSGRLKRNGIKGGILLISSLAGMIGPPFVAPYAATKAFNILLAESLSAEFRKTGIDISVCCTGTTSTPRFWASKPDTARNKIHIMDSGDVANYSLARLGRQTIITPGMKNRLNYSFLLRFLPRKTAANIVAGYMKRLYPERSGSVTPQ